MFGVWRSVVERKFRNAHACIYNLGGAHIYMHALVYVRALVGAHTGQEACALSNIMGRLY
jgi:hypothetical protein